MPKTGNTDSDWQRILAEFARKGEPRLGQGRAPGVGTSAHRTYKTILDCPRHGGQKKLSFYLSKNAVNSKDCRCGFHRNGKSSTKKKSSSQIVPGSSLSPEAWSRSSIKKKPSRIVPRALPTVVPKTPMKIKPSLQILPGASLISATRSPIKPPSRGVTGASLQLVRSSAKNNASKTPAKMYVAKAPSKKHLGNDPTTAIASTSKGNTAEADASRPANSQRTHRIPTSIANSTAVWGTNPYLQKLAHQPQKATTPASSLNETPANSIFPNQPATNATNLNQATVINQTRNLNDIKIVNKRLPNQSTTMYKSWKVPATTTTPNERLPNMPTVGFIDKTTGGTLDEELKLNNKKRKFVSIINPYAKKEKKPKQLETMTELPTVPKLLSPPINVAANDVRRPGYKKWTQGSRLPRKPVYCIEEKWGVDFYRSTGIRLFQREGYLDLLVFAPVTGHCPYCKSRNIYIKDKNTWMKPVYMMTGFPMYCIGADIKCNEKGCGRIIKSMDSKYVVTLPLADRQKMPFIQTGREYGVDIDAVIPMRLGTPASRIVEQQNMKVWATHASLRNAYNRKTSVIVKPDAFGMENNEIVRYDCFEPFQDLERGWLMKDYQLQRAFLADFQMHHADLCRELQTIRSQHTLACDHQRQVVKRVKQKGSIENGGTQSFVITGDLGLVLNYCVVPSTAEEWTHDALDEVCRRFKNGSKPPSILYVDCGCCNGLLRKSEETVEPPVAGSSGYRLWKTILKKKLDGLHVIFRLTRECNAEHPRYIKFCQEVSAAIYFLDPECERRLEEARKLHGLQLSDKEKRKDSSVYGRRTPGPGHLVAKRLLLVMEANLKKDQDALLRMERGGVDCCNIKNRAHAAYPLITKKVREAFIHQTIHCLNGCLDPEGALPHVETGLRNYRNTNTFLMTYRSLFGTSRCETFHSVAARHFAQYMNIRALNFDAKMLWKVTHYNRNKQRQLDPDGMIPGLLAQAEFGEGKIIPEGELSPLYFGHDYCQRVLGNKNCEIYGFDLNKFSDQKMSELAGEQIEEQAGGTTSAIEDVTLNGDSGILFDNDIDTNFGPVTGVSPYDVRTSLSHHMESLRTAVDCNDLEATAAGARDILAATNPNATWADTISESTKRKGVSPKKNVYHRKNIACNATHVPVVFNETMLRVWREIFTEFSATRTILDRDIMLKMMHKYAARMETHNRTKRASDEPLLVVHFSVAEEWIKDMIKERNKPMKDGKTSDTSIAISQDLEKILNNEETLGQTSARIEHRSTLELRAPSAITWTDLPECDNLRPQPPKQYFCSTCGCPFGTGRGKHLRGGGCSKAPKPQRVTVGREEQKQFTNEYSLGLEARRKKAVIGIREHHPMKPPPPSKTAKVDDGYLKCAVCFLPYWKKTPNNHYNWHLVKNKQWLYCPWSETRDEKEHIEAELIPPLVRGGLPE